MSDLYKFVVDGSTINWFEQQDDGSFAPEDLKLNQTLSFDAATSDVTLTSNFAQYIRVQVFHQTASTLDDPSLYTKPVTSFTALDGTPITGGSGGAGNDTVKGNEGNDTLSGDDGNDKVLGGDGADHVSGGAGDDMVNGDLGDDTLTGDAGNDKVSGGAGDDSLSGGSGKDLLTGGLGADHFVFADGDLSGTSLKTADRITDFSHAQGDMIDLSGIDADTVTAGHQSFAFIGTAAFSHTAGELHLDIGSKAMLLSGDTNGDGLADFAIRIDGTTPIELADLVL